MDIATCRFFPSGKVVLSGGADFALRIWDLQTGNCAAMLKGHRKGVEEAGCPLSSILLFSFLVSSFSLLSFILYLTLRRA
jgi:WD40 repeat protein